MSLEWGEKNSASNIKQTESQWLLVLKLLSQLWQHTQGSLARPERKKGTATEVFDVHISYLLS